jgi:hypothetical protein
VYPVVLKLCGLPLPLLGECGKQSSLKNWLMNMFVWMMLLMMMEIVAGKICGKYFQSRVDQMRNSTTSRIPLDDEGHNVELLFDHLKRIATLYQEPGMPSPCYVWKCQREEYKVENFLCRWCLPYAIIPGMPKSGTSELFAFLENHPKVRGWGFKEINIFSRLELTTIEDFEVKVSAHLTSPNMSNTSTWWVDPHSYWIDGSAICSYHSSCMDALSKYSPATKSLVMVRDPFQRFASFVCMKHQHSLLQFGLLNRTSERFVNWLSEISYNETILMKAEYNSLRTIYFIQEMRRRRKEILVIDNYDLYHSRDETMTLVESFLGLPPLGSYGDVPAVNSFGEWGGAISQQPHSQFIYRFNNHTTHRLTEVFADFLCLYKIEMGQDLHIVTPNVTSSLSSSPSSSSPSSSSSSSSSDSASHPRRQPKPKSRTEEGEEGKKKKKKTSATTHR